MCDKMNIWPFQIFDHKKTWNLHVKKGVFYTYFSLQYAQPAFAFVQEDQMFGDLVSSPTDLYTKSDKV